MESCSTPVNYIYTHIENNCICVGERRWGEDMESSSSSSKYDFDAMELEDEEKLQVCVWHIPHNHMAYIGHHISYFYLFSYHIFVSMDMRIRKQVFKLMARAYSCAHTHTHTHDAHSYTSHVHTGSTHTCWHSLPCRRTIDTLLLFKHLPLATPPTPNFFVLSLFLPLSASPSLSPCSHPSHPSLSSIIQVSHA